MLDKLEKLFCPKCIVSCIGGIVLFVIIAKLLRFFRLNLFIKNNLKEKYGKAGDWALVTGASAGIGESFAHELASRGFNVAVVARRKNVLDDLCNDIERKYNVKTKAIEFDFAVTSEDAYRKLFKELGPLQIAILVNNVGLSYPNYQNFGQQPVQFEVDMLNINCQSVLRLTHHVLPRMREAGAGAVITVSSTYGTMPAPMLGAYGGTKAFGKHFSYSMGLENKEYGIDFLAVSPMFVFTAMSGAKKPTGMMVLPQAVAAGALDRCGHCWETIGTFKQELIASVLGLLPEFIGDKMSLDQSKDMNRRWVKKQERDAAAAAADGSAQKK